MSYMSEHWKQYVLRITTLTTYTVSDDGNLPECYDGCVKIGNRTTNVQMEEISHDEMDVPYIAEKLQPHNFCSQEKGDALNSGLPEEFSDLNCSSATMEHWSPMK